MISLLKESREGVERVKTIIRDLKSFAHRDAEEEWRSEDLHQALETTLHVVWNELKYKCKVIKDYGEPPPVECILSQLHQVFMNLLINAAQAIETRGTITIATGWRVKPGVIPVARRPSRLSRECFRGVTIRPPASLLPARCNRGFTRLSRP